MEAMTHKFQTSCPWELLYADHLVIIVETLDQLLETFGLQETNMESKGLRVNVGKTRIMPSRGEYL